MTTLDLDDIHGAIRARHLCVPRDRFLSVGPDRHARIEDDRLAAAGFDNAPVVECDQVIGVFRRADHPPDVLVADVMAGRQLDHVVTADTPYRKLLRDLMLEPLLLVLDGRAVIGLVTPGDMGSAPGRTHFYLLLSGLEIAAAAWVRRLHEDQTNALALLTDGRQEKLRDLHAHLAERDEHLDLVAALSLQDLLRVLERTAPAKSWLAEHGLNLKAFGALADFRNDVMHPVRAFTHASPAGLERLCKWDDDLTRLVSCVSHQADAPSPSNSHP